VIAGSPGMNFAIQVAFVESGRISSRSKGFLDFHRQGVQHHEVMTLIDRRTALIGFGAAALAATAAACAPAPVADPPTTAVPPPLSTTSTSTTAPATTTTTVALPPSVSGAALILHVARRLSFGPTPALVAEITAKTVDAWVDEQLQWQGIDESALGPMLALYPKAAMTAAEISATADPFHTRNDMAAATMVRAIWGRRQLHEMLVDFWTNHLNVDINHEASTRHKPTDDRDVIRKHATGRFADMLLASAKSPAMLLYLDQALSRADNGRLPIENYAREMMELHTLGVNGGYDETDVKEVAYLLSGWSVVDRTSGGFQFRQQWHQMGPLATGGDVLGWRPNGLTGVAAGESLLDFLAHHPNTAKRLAWKLSVRFIGEHVTATDSVVRDAAQAYLDHDTAIIPMVRSILSSTAFRTSAGLRARRPIEYMAANLRSVQIQMNPTYAPNLSNLAMSNLGLLGQVPHAWGTPDGYPDSDSKWLSAGSLVARWNLSTAITGGFGAPVPTHDLTRLIGSPAPGTWGTAIDLIALAALGEALDPTARVAILSAFSRTAASTWPPSTNPRGLVAAVLQSPQNQVR